MARRVYKTHYAEKFTFSSTVSALGLSSIAYRRGAFGALIKCRICVANFDGNASSKLLAMSASPDTSDGFDKSRLAMVDVACCANVNAWLIPIFFDIPVWECLFPMQQWYRKIPGDIKVRNW